MRISAGETGIPGPGSEFESLRGQTQRECSPKPSVHLCSFRFVGERTLLTSPRNFRQGSGCRP